MATPLTYLMEGSRIFLSSWKHRLNPKMYEGTAEDICRQIVKDCWNGTYFQTSTGNFSQFWTRDFGWCTQSLLSLGYDQEVHKTLRYALNRFMKYNAVTSTITPQGKPYNFPKQAVDSLPWLIHSIKASKFTYYPYKGFLNKQIHAFFETFVNPHTGLIKPELYVSSMKDFAKRKSSCYDNCMVARLAKDIEKLGLDNPFKEFNYPSLIKRHFWSGTYFYDDLTKKDYIAGDANIFPIRNKISTESINGCSTKGNESLTRHLCRLHVMHLFNKVFRRKSVVISAKRIEHVFTAHTMKPCKKILLGVRKSVPRMHTTRHRRWWSINGIRLLRTFWVKRINLFLFPKCFQSCFNSTKIIRCYSRVHHKKRSQKWL